MSEMGEDFAAMREQARQKRASNTASSTALLKASGVVFESKNGGAHLVVTGGIGLADFWPSTGLWLVRGQKKKHGGVRKLIQWTKHQSFLAESAQSAMNSGAIHEQ